MKRILLFALTLLLLVGMVPEREAKAALSMTFDEFMEDYYGGTSGKLYDFYVNGSCTVDGKTYYLEDVRNFLVYMTSSYYQVFVFFGDDISLVRDISYTTSGKFYYIKIESSSDFLCFYSFMFEEGKFYNDGTVGVNTSFKQQYAHFTYDVIYRSFEFKEVDETFLNSPAKFNLDINEEYFIHTHNFVAKELAAGCTTSGKTWEECSCGATQNETELPALGHTWEVKEELGSCTVDSKTWEECSICGAVQNETELPAIGHGELVYKVTQNPTVEAEGIYVEECEYCGEVINTGTIPRVTPTNTLTPTPVPSGTISLNIKDSTAKADYEISGGFESFYLELLSSETLDGTFTKLAVSRNFTSSGTGSYTFNNILQHGSYYIANLLLSDNTLLAQSEKGYVVKDDAVVGLDISVSEDGTVSGAYALSGGQAITADLHLQESKSGIVDDWVTVDTAASVTGEGTAFSHPAKDYYHYRIKCDYVCTNDDGVDVSGIRYSAQVWHELPPDPVLQQNTSDFLDVVILMMLVIKEFPLNLFLVGVFIAFASLIFSLLFKRGGK